MKAFIALALTMGVLSAHAETKIYPEIANTRGPMAHCFEAGVCLISGHLSNGQQCWVEELDEKGNCVGTYWGSSWHGQELLEKHVAEHCEKKTESTPCPTPTVSPTPEPSPTPTMTPTPMPSPEPTHTPRPKPRPKHPKGGDDAQEGDGGNF